MQHRPYDTSMFYQDKAPQNESEFSELLLEPEEVPESKERVIRRYYDKPDPEMK